MAAVVDFVEYNGVGMAGPTVVTACDWKSVDDTTTPRGSASIVAGQHSMEKWLALRFSGTGFNTIGGGYFTHSAGDASTGVTLKAIKSMTADSDRLTYTQPSQTANANLTSDITVKKADPTADSPWAHISVWFGPTSPNASGKAATSTPGVTPIFSNFLTTQKQSSTLVGPNDDNALTLLAQWVEN